MKMISLALLLLGMPAFGLDRPQLQILNAGPKAVEIYWEMEDGHRVPNGKIEAGEDRIIGTTIGHRFVIVDGKRETGVVCQVKVQGFRYDPEAADGVPRFYTQRADAGGYPIVGSARLNPYALKEAVYLADLMLT
ncbi:hypothetical protein [Brevifollis gellanilyticus]|uniref:Uncharacterized protein n=1 Tax=Brevifollis gellanilyticus TaxID=748831 RepID=A0A512M4B6_9BACT|nr:hypothetical protein [Brevifollis gellanilyticus]GEP41587.1 hypothetical protein BGE01nite_08780 [Brevifollis gellanilyticus]